MKNIQILTFLCGFLILNSSVTYAKVLVDEKINNLGWPNFFKPKLAILRENEDGIEDEKTLNQRTEDTLAEDFREDTRKKLEEDVEGDQRTKIKEEQDKVEEEEEVDFMDVSVKGGLRGILIDLNSTDEDLQSLSIDTRKAIAQVIAKDLPLLQEAAEQEYKGQELSDDGVRLKTPLFLRKHSKGLGRYGSFISIFASDELQQAIYYGNWCGRGGRSAAHDHLDACCLSHAQCLGRLIRQCPLVWKKPYNKMYAWLLLGGDPVCVRSENSCVNHVCDCDRKASLCIRHFLANREEVPLEIGGEDEEGEEEEEE